MGVDRNDDKNFSYEDNVSGRSFLHKTFLSSISLGVYRNDSKKNLNLKRIFSMKCRFFK